MHGAISSHLGIFLKAYCDPMLYFLKGQFDQVKPTYELCKRYAKEAYYVYPVKHLGDLNPLQ